MSLTQIDGLIEGCGMLYTFLIQNENQVPMTEDGSCNQQQPRNNIVEENVGDKIRFKLWLQTSLFQRIE